MMLNYLILFSGVSSLLLAALLFQTKKNLYALQKKYRKNFSMQNTFTKAVAGIEADLEREKLNSSLLFKVLDTIHDGVALMDHEGCLKYANSALWHLYQIDNKNDRKRYINQSWLNLHNAKGQLEIKSKVLPVLESNRVWLGESDVMTQKNRLIRAELYIAKSSAGYIGFIRDVSTRYEAEQENRKLSIQLHEMKKYEAMERIMCSIVHEFSNSLSAVTGLSELLAEEVKDKSQTAIYAKKITACGVQMQFSLDKARALLPNARKPTVFSGLQATTEALLQAAQG